MAPRASVCSWSSLTRRPENPLHTAFRQLAANLKRRRGRERAASFKRQSVAHLCFMHFSTLDLGDSAACPSCALVRGGPHVEKRNQRLPRRPLRQTGEAAQVAQPDDRADGFTHGAPYRAVQHPCTGQVSSNMRTVRRNACASRFTATAGAIVPAPRSACRKRCRGRLVAPGLSRIVRRSPLARTGFR